MYLYSKSYENKYKKYKSKYQILKNQLGGVQRILNAYNMLPNPEEEDIITTQNLLDLCPDERITIQNKYYAIRSLYKWIIEEDKEILPGSITIISQEDKQNLIQAYETLIYKNILTRNKLILLYPNLQQATYFDLSYKNYINIVPDIFSDILPNLTQLYLENNQIKELQPMIFNNLPRLHYLDLKNNQIQELHPNIFNNLPLLQYLYLENNHIHELQPNIFNNLSALIELNLNNNQIKELQPAEVPSAGIFAKGTFGDNLASLERLDLSANQIKELQPGIFDNLPQLKILYLNNNKISELQPGIFAKGTFGDNLLELQFLYLDNNQISELQIGLFNLPKLKFLHLCVNAIVVLKYNIFINLPKLEQLFLNGNPILFENRLRSNFYYGLTDDVIVHCI